MNIQSTESEPPVRDETPRTIPASGLSRYFHILGANFLEIIKLNLLVTLFCLPIVTIPAVATAASCVCYRMATDQPYHVWADFWERFRSEFFRSFCAGLLYAVVTAVLVYTLKIGIESLQAGNLQHFFLAALPIVGLGLCYQAAIYTFALLGIVQLELSNILLNSLRLLAFRPLANMLSFCFFVVLTAVMILTFPFTLPLVFFLYAGPVFFTAMYLAKDGIQRCIQK